MVKFKLVSRNKEGKFAIFTNSRWMLIALMAMCTLLTSAVAASETALAEWAPIEADMNGRKYVGSNICVGSTLPAASYPVAAIAQQWNVVANRTDGTVLRLDYSTNCAADGYIPRQTMTIGVFNNPSHGSCFAITNDAIFPYGDSNMVYWQSGPGVYINVGIPGCVSTAQRRAHQVAAAIGYPLGMSFQTTSNWAQRVMCSCSINTLRSPSYAEGERVMKIYQNKYGGTF
jgi:hypothetical protein